MEFTTGTKNSNTCCAAACSRCC